MNYTNATLSQEIFGQGVIFAVKSAFLKHCAMVVLVIS